MMQLFAVHFITFKINGNFQGDLEGEWMSEIEV